MEHHCLLKFYKQTSKLLHDNMFGKIWDFVKRHRKKIVITGVVIVGGKYVFRYVGKKLLEFQEKEAAECLVQARRQHHFDSNQRTCNMTVLSMLPTLRERVTLLVNTEEVTEQLKTNPSNKLLLWEDLKILGFTRVISVVYACSLMCTMLRVQLNVIGGYMYIDNFNLHKDRKVNEVVTITPTDVQEKYLALIRDFFDIGLRDLVAKVKEAVIKETSGFSLKERLSLQNIEAVLKHIRERVEDGVSAGHTHIPTLPLCQYLVHWDDQIQSEYTGSDIYTQLLQETKDILYSSDFHTVLATGLDRGFAKLIDYLAEFYKHSMKTDASVTHFHEVSVPIAKLIPYLSRLLHKLGSDAPNPLVQELLLLEQTKTLAANIYEAFSQTEDDEDEQFAP